MTWQNTSSHNPSRSQEERSSRSSSETAVGIFIFCKFGRWWQRSQRRRVDRSLGWYDDGFWWWLKGLDQLNHQHRRKECQHLRNLLYLHSLRWNSEIRILVNVSLNWAFNNESFNNQITFIYLAWYVPSAEWPDGPRRCRDPKLQRSSLSSYL